MSSLSKSQRTVVSVFWICACATLIAWALSPGYVVGWDLNVYRAAMTSLRNHHDPYADAIAIQRIFHAHEPHPPGTPVPFCYVYSPITLPLVALAAKLPLTLDGLLYWTAFIASTIFTLWFSVQFLETNSERKIFAFLLPAAVFFPGLLQNDVIFSGNIAYILYAMVFLGAWIGWRKQNWLAFYLILVAASCVKAPLLFLVVIPVLSARKQWLPTVLTIIVAVGLFVVQPHLWPTLYRNYLMGVELQFSFNHDFSSSPSGLLADALFYVLPYKIVWAGFWAFTSLLFGGILLWLRGRFLAGSLTLNQWIPLMLVGVALLNPRIMEYDVAPMTVLMALVVWRTLSFCNSIARQSAFMVLLFLIANGFAAEAWRPTECITLVIVFFSGTWGVWMKMRASRQKVQPKTLSTRLRTA